MLISLGASREAEIMHCTLVSTCRFSPIFENFPNFDECRKPSYALREGAFIVNYIRKVRNSTKVSRTKRGFSFHGGISRLGSAFIFWRWFKLVEASFRRRNKQGINHKFLTTNQFHVTLRIISPYICKQS